MACTAPSGVEACVVLLPCNVPTAIRSMVKPAKIIASNRPITVPPGVQVLRLKSAGTQLFQACDACLEMPVQEPAQGCCCQWEAFPREFLPSLSAEMEGILWGTLPIG